jgi:hypothetical protein
MPTGKYRRKPLRAIQRPLNAADPRNLSQPHFREAWLNLAGAIGRLIADEDYAQGLREAAKERESSDARKRRLKS